MANKGSVKLCPMLKSVLLQGGRVTPEQMGCPLSWVFEDGTVADSKGAKNIMHELVIGLLARDWEREQTDANYYVLSRRGEKVRIYRNKEDIIIKYKKARGKND